MTDEKLELHERRADADALGIARRLGEMAEAQRERHRLTRLRVVLHLGASLTAYALLVSMRAADGGAQNYHQFHPYLSLFLVGVNLGAWAIYSAVASRPRN